MQGQLRELCMKSVFITGSNRGIGLEFVKQLTQLETPPKHIFAACRNPSAAKELQEIASQKHSVHVLELDVQHYENYKTVVDSVENSTSDEGLNLLINNAGILDRSTIKLKSITPAAMRKQFEVNSIAPLMLTKALLPLLYKASKKYGDNQLSCSRSAVVNISSNLGSLTTIQSGDYIYGYGSSKAALNIITKSLSKDLNSNGILTCAFHPGWVRTAMGSEHATINTEKSVVGMLKVMAALNNSHTGSFYNYRGQKLPWYVEQYDKLPDVTELVARTVGDDGLNLLINNAGILDQSVRNLDTVTPEGMRKHFEVNTVAPLMIVKAFLPLIRRAAGTQNGEKFSCSRAAIMNITSKVASVDDNKGGSMYAYRCSKSALNILTKSLSIDLKDDGIIACVLHPGWVQTDMGGQRAITDTPTSVTGMMKVMAAFQESKSGSFYDFKGIEIPW